MEIQDEFSSGQVALDEIECSQCFMYLGDFFMLTTGSREDTKYCVKFKSGETINIPRGALVTPVKAKIIIQGVLFRNV